MPWLFRARVGETEVWEAVGTGGAELPAAEEETLRWGAGGEEQSERIGPETEGRAGPQTETGMCVGPCVCVCVCLCVCVYVCVCMGGGGGWIG